MPLKCHPIHAIKPHHQFVECVEYWYHIISP